MSTTPLCHSVSCWSRDPSGLTIQTVVPFHTLDPNGPLGGRRLLTVRANAIDFPSGEKAGAKPPAVCGIG